MVTVAVQIVTYNSATSIAACIQSVQQQRVSLITLCDLIVIDNASSDNTLAMLHDADIQVIRNTINRGYAAAHNQALEQSHSDYVLTLNPDVVLDPLFLETIITAMELNHHLGAASGLLTRIENIHDHSEQIDSAGLYLRRNRRQGLRGENQTVDTYIQRFGSSPHPIFGPDGAAAVYRRSMLNDIALQGQVFDADFFMHKEDIDIVWRAAWRGWNAACVPQARAAHIRTFRPGRRREVSPAMRFYGVRNRYLLLIKNEVWPHLLRDLPWILVYDLQILLYLLCRERTSLSAYRNVWQLLPAMRQKRRILKAQRRVTWGAIKHWFKGDRADVARDSRDRHV